MCWGAPLKNVSVFTDWVLRVMGHFAFFACHSSCGIVRCTAPCFSFVSLGSNSCGLCLALCLLGRRLRFVCLCMLQPCVCMPVLFVLFVVCTCCTLVYLACLLFPGKGLGLGFSFRFVGPLVLVPGVCREGAGGLKPRKNAYKMSGTLKNTCLFVIWECTLRFWMQFLSLFHVDPPLWAC